MVRWKRATPRFGHCKRNHPQGWRGKMRFVPVGTHRQWCAVWIFRCISQASCIYPPDLRFWEFWKPIEDRKFSWCCSLVWLWYPCLSRERSWIQGALVYKRMVHMVNFQVSVLMLLTTSGSCLSTTSPTQAFEIHHFSKASWKPTFFPEGFAKSFRRNWTLSLLNSSLHSSSLWQPHSDSSWDPVFSCYYMCVHSVTRLCQLFVTPWTVAH